MSLVNGLDTRERENNLTLARELPNLGCSRRGHFAVVLQLVQLLTLLELSSKLSLER